MGNYIAHMKIQTVPSTSNRPDGYKVNFVLVSLDNLKPVLLIDNHKPFGYHLHPNAENDHGNRIELDVKDPFDALDIFVQKAKEITS